MKVEEAKEKVCPFMSDDTQRNCICEPCMLWVSTVNGKKEVERYKMPYDIYPMEEGNLHRSLINRGYVEEGRKTYVKYEKSYEGYCIKLGDVK